MTGGNERRNPCRLGGTNHRPHIVLAEHLLNGNCRWRELRDNGNDPSFDCVKAGAQGQPSTEVRTTSAYTSETRRRESTSTTANPQRVRPGSTPNTRMCASCRASQSERVNRYTFSWRLTSQRPNRLAGAPLCWTFCALRCGLACGRLFARAFARGAFFAGAFFTAALRAGLLRRAFFAGAFFTAALRAGALLHHRCLTRWRLLRRSLLHNLFRGCLLCRRRLTLSAFFAGAFFTTFFAVVFLAAALRAEPSSQPSSRFVFLAAALRAGAFFSAFCATGILFPVVDSLDVAVWLLHVTGFSLPDLGQCFAVIA